MEDITPQVRPASSPPLLDEPKQHRQRKPPPPPTDVEVREFAHNHFEILGLTKSKKKEAYAYSRSCLETYYLKRGKIRHRVCCSPVFEDGSTPRCEKCGSLPDVLMPEFLRNRRKGQ